jgi:putative restriction endonuclease
VALVNAILRRRDELARRHYITKADPQNAYWFNFYAAKLNEYQKAAGRDFCLVIAGDPTIETDFFAIPFPEVAHMFTAEYLAPPGANQKRRWIGTIRDNKLRVTNCPVDFDAGEFFSNPYFLDGPVQAPPPEAVLNDYAIENRRIEINARLKQSVFRRQVMANFGGRCCLSGVNEPALLTASHIIPWSVRVDSRLDPANGLCLNTGYDVLFDRGLITFSNDLVVIVPRDLSKFSRPVRAVLKLIRGKQATLPKTFPIKPEYLEYHREKIFGKSSIRLL